ncbi:MAG: circularly permuted type 2 ATP-grasp protein [Actinobacteria bacterium]|nr:circularly permuted type 2 ATP-grasp protein [Actinomycetota bacterium]
MIQVAVEHRYRPASDGYDEMVDRSGQVRGHWSHLSDALDGLGPTELRRRQAETARLLDDDGVTYNLRGGPSGSAARWNLDPVPLLLTSDEWAHVESAVIQRAELLNLVLTDLYGPRDLIRRGLIPPELVFGHGGFVRECDQVRLPGPLQLFTAATDVARDHEGHWWVLADRTQAPSGSGYALENRVVVSRVFPSLYRDAQVHRLAPFFRALRAGLQAVAPPSAGDPRIVVLTPGPHSETAFEHALLASRLGYSLVEGSDLIVQDGRVWVRSLRRLEPVDVILRRVDTWFCDPLELRPDSHLGVAGLMEACRRGTVSVVNTLGSSVLENPGLLPLLPRLATELLGHPLEMPSVPTWWCGDDASRSHVLATLERLVIKPVTRGNGRGIVFGWQCSREQLDEVRRRIEAHPWAWVGQEQLALGSTPTLADGGLEARRVVLRAFTVARDGSYVAMAGGLARVAPDGGPVISNQAGGVSKDTWVLASEPEKMTGLWLDSGPIAAEPTPSISSRAAENFFWMARYAERADAMVRLLRVTHERRNEFQHGMSTAGLECMRELLAALTRVTASYPGFVGEGAEEHLREPGPELQSLAVDDARPGSLAFAVHRLLEAAYAVRDQLSMDTWLVVSSLPREVLEAGSLGRGTLGRVLASLLALAGLEGESMVRDPGWRFMDAGRRIERADQLTNLLRAIVVAEREPATDSLLLESLLTAAESIITYRRLYRSRAQLETVLDLLLLHPDNPRSLVFQVDRLLEDVRTLPGGRVPARVSAAEKHALETSTVLRLADTALLASVGPHGTRPELDEFLARISDGLRLTAAAIAEAHFTHLLPQRSMLTPADPGGARTTGVFA